MTYKLISRTTQGLTSRDYTIMLNMYTKANTINLIATLKANKEELGKRGIVV